MDISYNKVEHLENIQTLRELDALYMTTNSIDDPLELEQLVHNSKLTTISFFGNQVYKNPGYRKRMMEILPEIDDIDGTPIKTVYKIISGPTESRAGGLKVE